MSNLNPFSTPQAPESNVGSVVSHAWENYKSIIGYGILLIIIASALSSIASSILQILLGIPGNDPELLQEAFKNNNYLLYFKSPSFISNTTIGYVVGIFLYPLYAGLLFLSHKANTQQELKFGDLFIGYRQNTLQIILYGFLSGLITTIGLVFCILPAILLGSMLFIGLPIVFFENKTAIEGIQKAFEISKKSLGSFLGIAVIASLIGISGILLCCVGIVATAPFVFVAMYSAYCAFCGAPYEIENTSL